MKTAPAKATPVKAASAKAAPAKPVALTKPAKAPKAAKGGKGKGGKNEKSSSSNPSKGSRLNAQGGDLDPWSPEHICLNPCADKSCKTLIEATGYCRLFYIKNWPTIQNKKKILSDGQLERYLKEIVEKYPDKYLDVIHEDLASPAAFARVVDTLELALETGEGGENGDEELEDIIGDVKPEIDEDPFE